MGDTNNIEDIKKFVASHGYSPELGDNDLYCFGVEYGDGSDEDHFHVGFTTREFVNI